VTSGEINNFAKTYAEAWCSQKPESVAAFFAERGSIIINNGPLAVGRAAIAKEVQAFMTTFPDMVVTMNKVVHAEEGTKFHWTLTGTNTGPGGTGKRVRISGYELWKIDKEGPHRRIERPLRRRGVRTPTEGRRELTVSILFSIDLARKW
jgi:hypothetical protein